MIRPDDYDKPMSLRDRIDTAKAQIMRDVLAGHVPADVADFSALHNHVDANYYGNLFNPGTYGESAPWEEGKEELPDVINPLQNDVDQWIRSGALRGGAPLARTYVVGIPAAITVHDDGRVSYEFDLSDIDGQEILEQADESVSLDVANADMCAILNDLESKRREVTA